MKRMMPWINIVAALVALAVNIMANALPLNGQSTAVISDKFKVLFVPAGYVFAIWGVIYIGWIAFIIYQALPAQRANPRLQAAGWLFALASLANAVWLFCWHYEQLPLSVVVMLALLGLLIALYVRFGIGRVRPAAAEWWSVDAPFGLYLGWISVATIANISDLLYYGRWDGFGIAPELWAVIMLAAAGVISLAMTQQRADVPYLLVIVWAAGIAVKQSPTPLVANGAAVTAVVVGLMIPLAFWLRRSRPLAAPVG